jgi:hypothetical protein
LDVNIAREQTHWIKYRTRSYKKRKKKKKGREKYLKTVAAIENRINAS